jgi:hypothetical protein
MRARWRGGDWSVNGTPRQVQPVLGMRLDSAGGVRIVRPETGGPKIHYEYDAGGNYVGSW